MDILEKIIRENCWRFDKGYPDMDIPKDVALLNEIVEGYKYKIKEDESKIKKSDLINLINDLDLDDDQITKLFNRTKNFTTYRPIKKTLDRKNYNPIILKKFSKEIQDLIEDLPKNEVDDFIKYLQDTDGKINFPTNSTGNLFKTLSKTGVPDEVVSKIIYHTSQDEGKRGVGMGEVGMSLLFKNVGSSTSGKGDLSVDGEEFEIKGEGATLGEKPGGFPINMDRLEPYGLTKNAKGYQAGDKKITNTNQFAFALAEAYNQTEDKKGFKEAVRDGLTNDVGLGIGVNTLFNDIDFTDPSSIQTNIALMNFVRYADKEGFNHFLAHDFGTKGPNTGEYIYVKGSPEDMAKQLRQAGAKFEKLAYNNLKPRIGFGSTKIQENV